MSKSDTDELSRILLTDSADTVREKIRKAVTDMDRTISYDWATRPGVSNLIDIASAFTGMSVEQVCETARQFDTVMFKNYLTDVIVDRLRPIADEITRLRSDMPYLLRVVSEGSDRARDIADDTYTNVCRLVGFGLP